VVLGAAVRAQTGQAGLDDVALMTTRRAESMPAVPVQERGRVGDEPALGLAQPRRRLPQRHAVAGSSRGRLAAHAAGADHRHAALAQGILVDREQRALLVDAQQVGVLAVELRERDELQAPVDDAQAAVAGDDGARSGMRALLGDPLGIAAAGVAHAVERRSRERVGLSHPLDTSPTA
jgi:hypothetical protein